MSFLLNMNTTDLIYNIFKGDYSLHIDKYTCQIILLSLSVEVNSIL